MWGEYRGSVADEYAPLPVINPAYEQAANEYCDGLVQEAQSSRVDIQRVWEENIQFARGKQWPDQIPEHRVDFVMNVLGKTIKNKAALITDTKPIIEVHPASDSSLNEASEILQTLCRGIWDERGIMESLTWGIYEAQIFGAFVANILWDKNLDFGLGDIDVRPWDTRHFLCDPGVVRANALQQGEFMVFEDLRPLDLIRSIYGKAARGISADAKFSTYSTYSTTAPVSGFVSHVTAGAQRQPFVKSSDYNRSSVIKRVVEQEIWWRDRRRMEDLPENIAKEFNDYLKGMRAVYGELPRYRERGPEDYVFNGGVRHTVRAGGKIVLDEGNPYFDMMMPGDLMSWGMEIEHPWGHSEVEDLRKIQLTINKLGGVITENAIKVSNPWVVGDFNALTEKQWQQIDDRPNVQVRKKPGSDFRREPAPALPGSTFATLNFLVQAVGELSGLTEAAKGGRMPSGTSGLAVEAMQLAAQSLIRLQAREFEGFLMRIGQKMISRIFQFYTTNRILTIFGPDQRLVSFEFIRDHLMRALGGRKAEDAWRDFKFKITPGSSLSMTRVQEGIMAANLFNMGLMPGAEVLKRMGIVNPEEMIQRAREERMMGQAPQAVPIRQGRGGRQGPASFPAAGQ